MTREKTNMDTLREIAAVSFEPTEKEISNSVAGVFEASLPDTLEINFRRGESARAFGPIVIFEDRQYIVPTLAENGPEVSSDIMYQRGDFDFATSTVKYDRVTDPSLIERMNEYCSNAPYKPAFQEKVEIADVDLESMDYGGRSDWEGFGRPIGLGEDVYFIPEDQSLGLGFNAKEIFYKMDSFDEKSGVAHCTRMEDSDLLKKLKEAQDIDYWNSDCSDDSFIAYSLDSE